MSSQQDLLFFLHIPKTAGTTLSDLLMKKFQPSEILQVMPFKYQGEIPQGRPYDVVSWDDYQAKLKQPDSGFSKYNLVLGHLYYDPPVLSNRNVRLITVLRDPIERFISAYLHTRRHDDNPLHSVAKELSLAEYVDHPTVRQLSGSNTMSYISNLKRGDRGLEIAKRNLQNLDFVGLTERLDDSMLLLHYLFGWSLDFKLNRLNTNQGELQYRDIPADVIEKIKDLNHYDWELYQFASQLFQQRFFDTVKALMEDKPIVQAPPPVQRINTDEPYQTTVVKRLNAVKSQERVDGYQSNIHYSQIPNHVQSVLARIKELDQEWHKAGSFGNDVLEAMAYYCETAPFPITHSVETGCGKSTLLLSHIATHHTSFTVNHDGGMTLTQQSPIINRQRTNFVEGPSQKTVPAYHFPQLQFAIIDGPHGYPFPEMEYYYIYQHLVKDALLIVDDIHIPTILNMFEFLVADEMFQLIDIIGYTAFFRRTGASLFNPLADGWFLQDYNKPALPEQR